MRGGTRPGSGRKALPKGLKRSGRLSVYLRPDEHRELLAAAAEDAQTAASWARDALLRALRHRKARRLLRRSSGT
jgi:hypothetical protein